MVTSAEAGPAAASTGAPVVLLGAAVPADFLASLTASYRVLGPVVPPFAQNVLNLPPADRATVQALITVGAVDTSRAAMAALPHLRIVSCIGTGYEGVDLAAARERGIAVTHSPMANASSVADLALGLAIASVRGFRAGERYLAGGEWQGNAGRRPPARMGLTGANLGIYGMGAIGERIALRALACEMHVGYYSRRVRSELAYAPFPDLLALAAWSDVLVVAVRADATTRHSVDAQVLAALGASGHVVNIARGSVIDEAALIAALTAGTLGGAGLDVYEHEPHVPRALLDLPNVITTPHVGGATLDAQRAMRDMVLANLAAHFAGAPAVTPVPD